MSLLSRTWGFPVVKKKKNPPASAEGARDTGSVPGSGRCPGGGNGNPLQYSYLEKSLGAAVHGVAKGQI